MATALLKISQIVKSSVGNVRKDLGNLAELTASIKAHGVLQPITVRPVGDNYEIVFGHRRLAAAKIAKLAEIAAIIKELTDNQVIELQLVENVQRVDIHPMDEAIGFFRLREDFKHSIEHLVKMTGKSKAYIYASLKLIELSAHAQEEFRKDKFDTSVALYIARLTTEEGMKQACKEVGEGKDWQGEKVPAREAFRIVDSIKKKEELDVKWEKVKAKAEKNGEKILPKSTAAKILGHGFVMQEAPYVDLDSQDFEVMKTYREIVAKAMPEVIHAQCPGSRKIFEIVTKKDFDASVKKIYGAKGYKDKTTTSPEVAKQNEKAAAFRKFKALATPLVVEKAITGPNANFLRAILSLTIDGVTHGTFTRVLLKAYDRKEATFRSSIETMKEKELRDELFILLTADADERKFANVCKLLKVSDAALSQIKQEIADEEKAKAQAKREREKAKAKKEADAKKKEVEKAKPKDAPKFKGRKAAKKPAKKKKS